MALHYEKPFCKYTYANHLHQFHFAYMFLFSLQNHSHFPIMNVMRVNWCGFKSLKLKTDLDTNVKIVFCFLFSLKEILVEIEEREWDDMLSISHG